MDKQLQQRLLGAAVIVALVVIFVPEFVKTPTPQERLPEPVALDREERSAPLPPAEPIRSREGETLIISVPRTLEEALPTAPEPVSDDAPVVLIVPEPVPLVETPPEPVAELPPPTRPEPPPPTRPEPPPPTRPEPPPPTRPEPPPPTRPEPPPPTRPEPPPVAEPELPELRLISRPMAEYQARAEPAEQPRWVLQVGSFESAANAGQLHDRLRAQQFPVTLSQTTVDGRTLYRVQIGPYSSRAEGERTRSRLQRDSGIEGHLIPVYN